MQRSRSILAAGLVVLLVSQAGCSTLFGGADGGPTASQVAGAPGYVPPQSRRGRLRMGVAGERFVKKRSDEGVFGGVPSPAEVFNDAKDRVGYGPDADEAEALYADADALYQAQEYANAEKKFRQAAAKWPDSSLEEDAMFMAAECQFFSDEYPDASDTYANLLKKFENSRHLDIVVARQFSIARYWTEKQQADYQPFFVPNFFDATKPWWDTTGNAQAVFQSVWMNDPTGPLADDSVVATANDYFVRGRFADADEYYEQLREDYPKSEHLANAFLLGIQAKLATYQGADYDDQPLVESEKLIKQALLQFPTQLASERERILETRQRIQELKAERDWFMGEYFAKNKYYRSAAHYYRRLLREAPNTELAAQAEARLAEHADKPDVPVNRFQWLVDLFPRSNTQPIGPAASAPLTAGVQQGSSRR